MQGLKQFPVEQSHQTKTIRYSLLPSFLSCTYPSLSCFLSSAREHKKVLAISGENHSKNQSAEGQLKSLTSSIKNLAPFKERRNS